MFLSFRGAVALDGRIEPGDMLLQVNDVDFQNMSNDDAVRVLREMVHKPGPITLTVAKCWDPSPQGYFTLPQSKLNIDVICINPQYEFLITLFILCLFAKTFSSRPFMRNLVLI